MNGDEEDALLLLTRNFKFCFQSKFLLPSFFPLENSWITEFPQIYAFPMMETFLFSYIFDVSLKITRIDRQKINQIWMLHPLEITMKVLFISTSWNFYQTIYLAFCL